MKIKNNMLKRYIGYRWFGLVSTVSCQNSEPLKIEVWQQWVSRFFLWGLEGIVHSVLLYWRGKNIKLNLLDQQSFNIRIFFNKIQGDS